MTTAESQLLQYYLTNYTLSCPPISYLQSYEFFILVMNILAPMSLVLGFLGIFLILKATPKEMASAKWAILNSHVSSFYFGSYPTVLVRPYIFFPSGAQYPRGLLLQLGVPFRVAVILGQTAYPMDGISTVMVFENRYSLISKHKWMGSRLRFVFYFSHYTFFLLLFIIHLSEPVDHSTAKLNILKMIPCPDPHFFLTDAMVMNINLARHSKISSGQSLYLFSLAHMFSLWSGYCLLSQKQDTNISEKTRSLQKRFLFALIVQAVVPFLVIFFPFLTYWLLMSTGTVYPSGGPIILICIALHGITSAILLIVLHKPYRQYPIQIFKGKKLKKTGDVARKISVVPASVN